MPMSLILVANTQALAPNLFTYFSGSGGVSPYNYQVLPRGIGGTINSTTGLYTAPNLTGQDVIVVTDALGATASLPVMVGTPLDLLCDIIQKEMNLDQGQVYLWDQKINIPTDSRLYVAVGVLSCKPFSNNVRTKDSMSGLDAGQYANFLSTVSIDILSRGPEARLRKEEVILALNSIYAQSQQEINSFYVAKLTTAFVNLSQIDGAAIPYQFNLSVNMQYCFTKTKAVPYYDQFLPASVTTEP